MKMFASNAAKRRAYQRLEVRAFALVLHPGVGVLFRVANRCQKQISQESKKQNKTPRIRIRIDARQRFIASLQS